MNQDILQQIAQLDKKIKIIRESWMGADSAKKKKWMTKLDYVIDERLKLMAVRDNYAPTNKNGLAPQETVRKPADAKIFKILKD